jgi:zinc protease
MFTTRSLVAAMVLVCGLPALAEPLPTDPALVTGTLPNGLRYIVRQNANPPGRANVWVHIHSGSLNETDRQRGIAHYLEHMAFNGSENFAPGTLVPYFQSLGMQFGRDQNAFTSFDQTTYQLTLPNCESATLGKGLTFFADVVGRLSLLPGEIESERQIIQEERRRGLSGRQRTAYYVLERIAPGSTFGFRLPIGTEETINSVTQADFKDYYNAWYGASNATLMVVADTDPAGVVSLIESNFKDLPTRARPTPADAKVRAYDRSFAIVTSDPEIRAADLRISRLEPARPATTTVEQMRDDLVAALAVAAMDRRLSDKVAAGGTTYQSMGVSLGNESGVMYSADITCRAEGEKWRAALGEMALELQRARAFGFSDRELEDARKEFLSGAERAVETEGTLPHGAHMGRLNAGVTDGEPILSASQRLALLTRLLPTINTGEVNKRFADEFNPAAAAFVAVLPSGADVPSEAELLALGEKALQATPTPDAERAHAKSLMETLPTPGTVAEGATHEASGVWTGFLSNGVRVNYRFMDERKNDVSVQVSLVGGEVLETAANRGVTRAAQQAWSRPATKGLSSTDIRELMTGKKVNVRGGGGFGGGRGGGRGAALGAGDSISLTISGSPAELETGFQLAHLLLTQPKIEAPAFDNFKSFVIRGLQESMKNPQVRGTILSTTAPFPAEEARTAMLTEAQVERLTLAETQAWLERLIQESPMEVTIVGDMPREAVMPMVERYLGSLASRERVSPATNAGLRALKRPAGPRVVTETIKTPTAQAFVSSGFYGADETNIADVRALNMAARILSTRMVKEVREDAQLVYSIGAASRPGSTYPGFGVFSAGAPTDPAKVPALIEKLASMYAAFAKDGPTDEEMTVAKKQMANTFEEQMRQAAFWSGRLDEIGYRGGKLDDILQAPAAYQDMTGEQVKSVFAKYYSPANAIVVRVLPDLTDAPQDGAKADDKASVPAGVK